MGANGESKKPRRRGFFARERSRTRFHLALLVLAAGTGVAVELVQGEGSSGEMDAALVPSFRAGRFVGAALFLLTYLSALHFVLLANSRPVTHALIWVPAALAVSIAVACFLATGLVLFGEAIGATRSGGVGWRNVGAAFDGGASLVPTVGILMALLPLLLPIDVLGRASAQAATRRRNRDGKDEETGLTGRHEMIRLLVEEQERSRRYGRPLSVALVELDSFVTLQTQHGREAEAEVLQEMGDLVRRSSRDVDRVGRWEAAEFLVLLPETEPETALAYARRLVAAVADHGYALSRRYPGPGLTASVGVAPARDDDKGPEDLIRRAQGARARARVAGGNGWALA